MSAPILKALSKGFSYKQIIDYLLKKFPDQSDKIQKALAAGFTADQVVKYLSGGMKSLTKEQETPEPTTEHGKTSKRDIQQREGVNRGALMAAGSIAAPMAISALQHAIPNNLLNKAAGTLLGPQSTQSSTAPNNQLPGMQPQLPSLPQQSSQPSPQQNLPIPSTQQPPINQVPPTVSQTTQPIQPKPISTNIIKNSIAYRNQIDALIKSGNGPEEIEAYLQKFNPAFVKTIAKEGGGDFKDVVKQYIDEKSQNAPTKTPENPIDENMTNTVPTQEMAGMNEPTTELLPESNELVEEPVKEPTKVAKGSLASSSNGVGKVLEIRGDEAIIDVDGKKHKVPVDELESEPEEIKEIDFDKLAKDYISGFPESERSTAMLMNFFVPTSEDNNNGQFYVMFPNDPSHIGIYENVSRELADKINSATNVAKTSGETILGKYEAGKPESRYAGATELRQNPEKYPYKKVEIPFNIASRLFNSFKTLEKERLKTERDRKNEEKKRHKKTS